MKNDKKKETAIKVENVSKTFRIPHEKTDSVRGAFVNVMKKNSYEEFNALKNVSFDVKKGEFFGIIGRNGSGKSTLLKIIAGIYKPNEGNIKTNGMISPFLELGIGFNPELSGRDNIYLNATVLGLSKKQIDEKFDDIVAFSELERFIDQKLKNYSSGMSVRLAFSVSIHANRDILLMDEVLAVGDSNFQKKCIDIFKGYKDKNRTVVLVTHDIATVRKYCDRAMLLQNGKITKLGDVDKVCDKYMDNNLTAKAKAEAEEQEKMKKKEELRVQKMQEKSKEDYEKKEATIQKVEILNKKDKEMEFIRRGETIIVKAKIKIKKESGDYFVAVQIVEASSDLVLAGNNMKVDEVNYKWERGINKINIRFDHTSFNRGDIYFKIAILKRKGDDNEIIDDYSGKKYDRLIKIIPQDERAGIVYMKHKWFFE